MSTRVKIYFDNPTAQYIPGERISGKVILLLSREKQILGIDVNLIGKTKVSSLNVDRQAIRRSHSRRLSTYGDKYFIIKDCKSLQRQGTEGQRLPIGTYEYPFSWILPENIPASFEGPYGWVRYRMEVVVRHSFWDHRCEAEAEFHVTGKYDLNILDKIFREVVVENKWLNRHNEYGTIYLELNFELERRMYVPGQTIKFAATSDLRSPECIGGHSGHPPISGVKVALIQEQTYKVKDTVRRHTVKIHEINGPMVFCNEIEVWNGAIDIVPVPPTALGGALGGGCRFIDVQYFLKVNLGITELDKIEMSIKLQIGTIAARRRRTRPLSRTSSPHREFSMSIELPQTPPPDSTLLLGPSQAANQNDPVSAMMDFISVVPSTSRRASAPPLWPETDFSSVVAGPSTQNSQASNNLVEPETPPPSYNDALFFGSNGFLDSTSTDGPNGTQDDDPPEYCRQAPFFLRKGTRHLYDSNNIYSTL